MIPGRDTDWPAAASPNQYESLSLLGNSKVCGVEDSPVGPVSHRCEAFLDRLESRSSFVG